MALREEATARFVGRGAVIGVGEGEDAVLTIMLAAPDPQTMRDVSGWAAARDVSVRVLLTGDIEANQRNASQHKG